MAAFKALGCPGSDSDVNSGQSGFIVTVHKVLIDTLLNSLCIQAVPSEVGSGAIQALYMRKPSVKSSSAEDVP